MDQITYPSRICYATDIRVGDHVLQSPDVYNSGVFRGVITAIYPRANGKVTFWFANDFGDGFVQTYPISAEFQVAVDYAPYIIKRYGSHNDRN